MAGRENGVAPPSPMATGSSPILEMRTSNCSPSLGYDLGGGPQWVRQIRGLDKDEAAPACTLPQFRTRGAGVGSKAGRPLSPGAEDLMRTLEEETRPHTSTQFEQEVKGEAVGAGWGSGHSSDSGVPARR